MDRLDDGVRRRREKAIDVLRTRYRFRLCPAIAVERSPDAGECGQGRSSFKANQTTSFFLVSGTAPARTPRRSCTVRGTRASAATTCCDVRHRRTGSGRRRRHSPSHHNHFANACVVSDHRRQVVGKRPGQRRQVANVLAENAEHRGDGGLVGGDALKIAHYAPV
jgi:hypothetical protein